jgi:hypothetical protein
MTTVDLSWKLRAQKAEAKRGELLEALKNMIGWAKYAEECDPFYFSEEQAPNWKIELDRAEAAIRNAEATE